MQTLNGIRKALLWAVGFRIQDLFRIRSRFCGTRNNLVLRSFSVRHVVRYINCESSCLTNLTAFQDCLVVIRTIADKTVILQQQTMLKGWNDNPAPHLGNVGFCQLRVQIN